MPKAGGELSPKQEKAIRALLSCGSQKEAAIVAGCSAPTLWRWLQQEAFKRAFREARAAVMEATIAQAVQLGRDAVQTLAQIMNDTEEPSFARLQAVAQLTNLMLKGTELLDQQERIEKLEALLREDSSKGLRVA